MAAQPRAGWTGRRPTALCPRNAVETAGSIALLQTASDGLEAHSLENRAASRGWQYAEKGIMCGSHCPPRLSGSCVSPSENVHASMNSSGRQRVILKSPSIAPTHRHAPDRLDVWCTCMLPFPSNNLRSSRCTVAWACSDSNTGPDRGTQAMSSTTLPLLARKDSWPHEIPANMAQSCVRRPCTPATEPDTTSSSVTTWSGRAQAAP